MTSWCHEIPWLFPDFFQISDFPDSNQNSLTFPWTWTFFIFHWLFPDRGNPELSLKLSVFSYPSFKHLFGVLTRPSYWVGSFEYPLSDWKMRKLIFDYTLLNKGLDNDLFLMLALMKAQNYVNPELQKFKTCSMLTKYKQLLVQTVNCL